MKKLHAPTILQWSVMPKEIRQYDMNKPISRDMNNAIQIGELFEMDEVKHFDVFKELSINAAAKHLLERGLADYGCNVNIDMAVSAGRSFAAASQQTQP
jgi:hypothetical protein